MNGLLRSLYAAVRRLCPTWEEWQVAVELYPLVSAADDAMKDEIRATLT